MLRIERAAQERPGGQFRLFAERLDRPLVIETVVCRILFRSFIRSTRPTDRIAFRSSIAQFSLRFEKTDAFPRSPTRRFANRDQRSSGAYPILDPPQNLPAKRR